MTLRLARGTCFHRTGELIIRLESHTLWERPPPLWSPWVPTPESQGPVWPLLFPSYSILLIFPQVCSYRSFSNSFHFIFSEIFSMCICIFDALLEEVCPTSYSAICFNCIIFYKYLHIHWHNVSKVYAMLFDAIYVYNYWTSNCIIVSIPSLLNVTPLIVP